METTISLNIEKISFRKSIKSIFCFSIAIIIFSFPLFNLQAQDSLIVDGKKVPAKEAINLILKENLENDNIIKVGEYCIRQDSLSIKFARKDSVRGFNEKYYKKERLNFRKRYIFKTVRKFKIKKVIISVENASIQNIYVYMEEDSLGVFSNQTNPIHNSIFTDSKRNDRLYSSNADNSYIYIKDVISYYFNDPKYDYLGEKVMILENNDGDRCKKIEYDGSVNSVFNLIVYSDLLGLIENQKNSLVQFDANVSVPLNQITIKTSNKIFSGFKFASQLDLDLVVSKFDSQFQEVSSTLSSDSLIQVNPLSVFQQSYINGKVFLTLFSWQLGKVIDVSLSAGSIYSLAGIENPNSAEERIDTDVISYGPKFTFKTDPSPVLKIETSFSYFWQTYNFDSQFEEVSNNEILNPEVVINYKTKADKNSSFFIRFQYFGVLNENRSFSQFQFGVKSSISNVLNKK